MLFITYPISEVWSNDIPVLQPLKIGDFVVSEGVSSLAAWAELNDTIRGDADFFLPAKQIQSKMQYDVVCSMLLLSAC